VVVIAFQLSGICLSLYLHFLSFFRPSYLEGKRGAREKGWKIKTKTVSQSLQQKKGNIDPIPSG
jgi:hypothetical protein